MAQKKKRVQPRKTGSQHIGRSATSKSKRRSARKTTARRPTSASGKGSTKKSAALALLKRKNGTTLVELMAATGWQAHSVRGFLSGTVRKQMNLPLESISTPTGRVYSIASNEKRRAPE